MKIAAETGMVPDYVHLVFTRTENSLSMSNNAKLIGKYCNSIFRVCAGADRLFLLYRWELLLEIDA
jgi:hypothetical protein